MKVPVWVEFSKEIEVDITTDDIRGCLATSPRNDSLNAALSLLNDAAIMFNGLPDTIIAEMTPKQREIVNGFLLKAASKFAGGAAGIIEAAEQPTTGKGASCLCVHDPVAGQEFVLQINDHCPQHGHLVRL